jgi:predicted nucleotidyltransferase
MDTEIIDKIKQLANQAKLYFEFEKVVVYGSYTKRTNTADSDIDVAFFVKEILPEHWSLSAKLFELVDKIDNRIEPIIINAKTDKSGFAQNILENGVVVC